MGGSGTVGFRNSRWGVLILDSQLGAPADEAGYTTTRCLVFQRSLWQARQWARTRGAEASLCDTRAHWPEQQELVADGGGVFQSARGVMRERIKHLSLPSLSCSVCLSASSGDSSSKQFFFPGERCGLGRLERRGYDGGDRRASSSPAASSRYLMPAGTWRLLSQPSSLAR